MCFRSPLELRTARGVTVCSRDNRLDNRTNELERRRKYHRCLSFQTAPCPALRATVVSWMPGYVKPDGSVSRLVGQAKIAREVKEIQYSTVQYLL